MLSIEMSMQFLNKALVITAMNVLETWILWQLTDYIQMTTEK